MFGSSHAKSPVSSPGPKDLSRRGRLRSRHFRKQQVTLEIIDDKMNVMPFDCFDISPVGAYLHSEFLLMPGDEVQLRLRLSCRFRPIQITGEVVRVEMGEDGLPPGMGIAFRDIAKQDSDVLKQFLLRRFLGNG